VIANGGTAAFCDVNYWRGDGVALNKTRGQVMCASSYGIVSTVLVAAGMSPCLSGSGGNRRCDPEWINAKGGGGGSNCGRNSADVKNRQINETLAVLILAQPGFEI